MVNYHQSFYNLLKDAVDEDEITIVYEKFIEKENPPVISYIEVNNSNLYKGDTLDFSNISFQVKVWTDDLVETLSISNDIERTLTDNGFSLNSTIEQMEENFIVKIMRFDGIGYEYR